MALVVPIRRDQPATPQGPMIATNPPDPNFLLMAAALMHRDGRLIQKDPAQNPQIGDIQEKFQSKIHRNAPTTDSITGGPFLHDILTNEQPGGDRI
jgi:hypothetical protein